MPPTFRSPFVSALEEWAERRGLERGGWLPRGVCFADGWRTDLVICLRDLRQRIEEMADWARLEQAIRQCPTLGNVNPPGVTPMALCVRLGFVVLLSVPAAGLSVVGVFWGNKLRTTCPAGLNNPRFS